VEILVDESVVVYVWCGNRVPTRSATRGGTGERSKSYKILRLPWRNILVIVWNYWALF